MSAHQDSSRSRRLTDRQAALLAGLRAHERDGAAITVDGLAAATGYTPATVATYIAKRLGRLLRAIPTAEPRAWLVCGASDLSDAAFAALPSQRADEMTPSPASARVDVFHLWSGTSQWACSIHEGADGQPRFVAHDPEVLTRELFEAILDRFAFPTLIWFGGQNAGVFVDGVRWGRAGDPGYFGTTVRELSGLVIGPSPIGSNGEPKYSERPSGPLFTPVEYEDRDLEFHEAYARLPIMITIDGLGIRWLGPLVDLALDRVLGDLAAAAYGFLEDCGWQDGLDTARLENGRLTDEFATWFGRAARLLGDAGQAAAPEPDAEIWASWIAFEHTELRQLVQGRAQRRGVDR